MKIEFQGFVTDVKPVQKGFNKNGQPWAKQAFKVDVINQKEESVWCTIFKEEKISEFDVRIGEQVKVGAFINTYEYNNNALANLNVYNVEKVFVKQPTPQYPQYPAQPQYAPQPQQPQYAQMPTPAPAPQAPQQPMQTAPRPPYAQQPAEAPQSAIDDDLPF